MRITLDTNVLVSAHSPGAGNARQLLLKILRGGHMAKKNQRLPLLGGDDVTADRSYIREFVLARSRELGKRCGVEYAEAFYYIGTGGRSNTIEALMHGTTGQQSGFPSRSRRPEASGALEASPPARVQPEC